MHLCLMSEGKIVLFHAHRGAEKFLRPSYRGAKEQISWDLIGIIGTCKVQGFVSAMALY